VAEVEVALLENDPVFIGSVIQKFMAGFGGNGFQRDMAYPLIHKPMADIFTRGMADFIQLPVPVQTAVVRLAHPDKDR
jgi:hypothetical protein